MKTSELLERVKQLGLETVYFNHEILINDKDKCRKKYKDFVIDKITIEDLMLLMIKGGK